MEALVLNPGANKDASIDMIGSSSQDLQIDRKQLLMLGELTKPFLHQALEKQRKPDVGDADGARQFVAEMRSTSSWPDARRPHCWQENSVKREMQRDATTRGARHRPPDRRTDT